MPNSYCTNLAKWLDSLLKKFLPTKFTIKDPFEFVEKLQTMNFSTDKYLVSYDVESLLTQMPVDETISFICDFTPSTELPVKNKTLKFLLKLA